MQRYRVLRFIASLGWEALAVLACAVALPSPALASWPSDPTVNVAVCTEEDAQQFPATLPDGTGGVFIVWQDYRSGFDDKVYAQRLSASGDPLWGTNGIPVCTWISGDQLVPHITTDGAGGAIVTWNDSRAILTDIYAQRLSPGGDLLWSADGVPLCEATGPQHDETLISDGAGGAIVVWWDRRDDPSTVTGDIFAQRVSAAGVVQWAQDGVPICIAAGSQQYPMIVPDGTEGAIIAWADARNGASNRDIYAQRVASDGVVQWAANGVVLCNAANDQTSTVMVSDGSGGAIVAWSDERGPQKTYAQRVAHTGDIQWAPNGVAVAGGLQVELFPAIVSDGAGGAIVAWTDTRNFPTSAFDIVAQRLSPAGAPLWSASGVVVCDNTGDQYFAAMTTDGAGGAIVTWEDHRGGPTSSDVYARRLTAAGAVQWGAATKGVAVSTAAETQILPVIATNGTGGAIVAWQDARNGTTDVYAQGVRSDGTLGGDVLGVPGGERMSFALDQVFPNPARGPRLSARFTLPGPGAGSLELLDVAGRRVAERALAGLGAGRHILDFGVGEHLAPGIYMVRLRQGANERMTRVAVLQ